MQLHADECTSPLDRRKSDQSAQRNVLADFISGGGELRAGFGGRNQSRPMPPLLGSGEAVDLLKLFVHVKKRGGYDAISREGLWEVVGEDQGLTSSGLGSAIKLIYYKYFLSSRRDSTNVSGAVDSEGEAVYGNLGGLDEADLMCFASKEREKNVEESEEGSTDGVKLCNGKKDWTLDEEVEVIEINSDSSDSSDDQRALNSVRSSRVEINGKEEIVVEDLSATKEEEGSSRKRKRKIDSTLSKMLDWMADVSKNPINPTIGTLPESSEWKSYGGEHCWKQVLMIRTALFHKRKVAFSPEQFPRQKKPKVHPSMFDEVGESAEKVRSSPRLQFSGSLGTSSNHISSISSFNLRKRIPVGPFFQAEVPEWTGVPAESDSKWLGTRIWPPEEKSVNYVIEEVPAQKKTRNRCSHEYPGSLEFIRSHVSRRRMKLKVGLGSAFYTWKFDKMGEEAATSWTKKDEKIFEAVVKANPLSECRCFWDELSKSLPTKSGQELVSYYFNVFLLRRRAHQNRYIPSNIDSDDDETEFIAKSSSFILSPGKKKVVG